MVLCKDLEQLDFLLFVPPSIADDDGYVQLLLNGTCGRSVEESSTTAGKRGHLLLYRCPISRTESAHLWSGPVRRVLPDNATVIALSHVQITDLQMAVVHSKDLKDEHKDLSRVLPADHIEKVDSQCSCHRMISESMEEVKKKSLKIRKRIVSWLLDVEDLMRTEDARDENERNVYRDVVIQAYNFAFDFHRQLFPLISGTHCVDQAQALRGLSLQWMTYVLNNCEQGKGTRPRWALFGLKFLETTVDPVYSQHYTDEEFQLPPSVSSSDSCSNLTQQAVPVGQYIWVHLQAWKAGRPLNQASIIQSLRMQDEELVNKRQQAAAEFFPALTQFKLNWNNVLSKELSGDDPSVAELASSSVIANDLNNSSASVDTSVTPTKLELVKHHESNMSGIEETASSSVGFPDGADNSDENNYDKSHGEDDSRNETEADAVQRVWVTSSNGMEESSRAHASSSAASSGPSVAVSERSVTGSYFTGLKLDTQPTLTGASIVLKPELPDSLELASTLARTITPTEHQNTATSVYDAEYIAREREAMEGVHAILQKLESMEDLYPNSRVLQKDLAKQYTNLVVNRLRVLHIWYNVSRELSRTIKDVGMMLGMDKQRYQILRCWTWYSPKAQLG
jgi:hypothetical protein